MSKIINNIWIGDLQTSQNKDFLQENNINVIVNCTKDLPNLYEPFTIKPLEQDILDKYFIKYYRVKANDNGRDEEVKNFWNDTYTIINDVVKDFNNNKNILIHCSAGQQRSCSFCYFLLTKLGYNNGFDMILEKRPEAFNFGKEYHFFSITYE